MSPIATDSFHGTECYLQSLCHYMLFHGKFMQLMRHSLDRNLKRLRDLNLDFGRFTDTGLQMLTGLTALRRLSLWICNNITEAGLRALVVPLSKHSLAVVDVPCCRGIPSWRAVGPTTKF